MNLPGGAFRLSMRRREVSLLWKNLWGPRPGAALDSAYNTSTIWHTLGSQTHRRDGHGGRPLLDKWDHLPDPCLTFRSPCSPGAPPSGQGGKSLFADPAAWPAGFPCVIHRVGSRCLSHRRCLPPRGQKFFHSLGLRAGPRPFPPHSSWPTSLCSPGPCPQPALR